MENRNSHGRRNGIPRSPVGYNISVSTVPRPAISPRVQKSGSSNSSPMHLISRNNDQNRLKTEPSQRNSVSDSKNKNAWNNRRSHASATNGRNILDKKGETRFSKSNKFSAPPPLTTKKNTNQKTGNASVAILKTGPFSPHANSHNNKYDHLNTRNVDIMKTRERSFSDHSKSNQGYHSKGRGEQQNFSRNVSSDQSKATKGRADSSCVKKPESSKKNKLEYSMKELRNLGRSRRVVASSRARPQDLLPMPITKIPYVPREKKIRKESDASVEKNDQSMSLTTSKLHAVTDNSNSYSSGYNKRNSLEVQSDQVYRSESNKRGSGQRDHRLSRGTVDSRGRSTRREGFHREPNSDIWDLPDEPWEQDSSFAFTTQQEAFEAEHKQMIEKMKSDTAAPNPDSNSSHCETERANQNAPPDIFPAEVPPEIPLLPKQKLEAEGTSLKNSTVSPKADSITAENALHDESAQPANLEMNDMEDIFKGFNLLGAIDDTNSNDKNDLSLMDSLFSFAPLGSSSTIDRYTELTGPTFSNGAAFKHGEKKNESSGLGKWFSVHEEEQPLDHKAMTSFEPTSALPADAEQGSPKHASVLLKNMLAVKEPSEGPVTFSQLKERESQCNESGAGLLESLGFNHRSTEIDDSPMIQNAKTKFTFHQQSPPRKVSKPKAQRVEANYSSYPEQCVSSHPRPTGIAGGFVPVSVLKQTAASKASYEKVQLKSKETPKNGVNLLARLFQTAGAALEGHKETLAQYPQMTSVDDLESMIS